MADDVKRVSQTQTKPIKLIKWNVRLGYTVSTNRVILTYEFCDQEKPDKRKLKAEKAGIIHKFWAQEGQIVEPGEPLYEIKACQHPTIMNDMCAECGTDLRKDDIPVSATASIPMVHAIPDLKVSEEQAQKLGKLDNDRLIKDRKLVLLVDLDQTLIHTTNDNIPPNIKDVYHFQLYGPRSPWYHTRLRPGTHEFLAQVSQYYELHICTFGARNYAHTIAMFLDPEQKFFSNRILSRDECFDPTSKKANLRALFPCGDDMVCIIDDREDVWSHALNLIQVKPYHFFQHTGDINAPPGLDKHEEDDILGCDLTKIKKPPDAAEEKETAANENEEKGDSKIEDEDENKVSSSDDKEANSSPNEENKPETSEIIEENEVEADSTENFEEIANEVQNDSTEVVKENGEAECKEDHDNQDETEEDTAKKETEANGEETKENTEENDVESSSETSNKIGESVDTNKKETARNGEESKNENSEKNVASSTNETSIITTENNGKLKSVEPAEDGQIEIEDSDDYLHYLQDVLHRIYQSYYSEFDQMNSGDIPDLKDVIPRVRSKILKGTKLCFSGLVPTRFKLEQSKAYQVAVSLGAQVTQDLEEDTTHLVAVRPGTVKVNSGKRRKNIRIVTPDWLWCCAERWEHVDERVFPVTNKVSKNRHPPPHCSSPKHTPSYPEHDTPAMRKRTPSGRFMDTINPLMSFSSDEIANMDKEVEDILDDDESDSDTETPAVKQTQEPEVEESSESEAEETFKMMIQSNILNRYDKDEGGSSSGEEKEESEDETDNNQRKRKLNDMDESSSQSQDEESPVVKFKRGGELDNEDLDMEDADLEDPDSDDFEIQDDMDDKEWNMMGAALEREFLSD